MRQRSSSFSAHGRVREGSLVVPVIMAVSMLVVLASGILAFQFFPAPEVLLRTPGEDDRSRRDLRLVLDDGELVVPYGLVARVRRRALGSIAQVDLQVPWPYDASRLPSSPEQARDLVDWVILTFEPREKLLDPAERLKKIYKVYFDGPPAPGPAGLTRHAFGAGTPYADLELFVSEDPDQPALIRCDLRPSSLGPTLCEARVPVSKATMMRYRFAQPRLGEWRQIDRLARTLLLQFFRPAVRP